MKRYFDHECGSVRIARKNGTDVPRECAEYIRSRKDASLFQGCFWCRRCLLRELAEHRAWQRKRFAELADRAPEQLTDEERAQWQELQRAIEKQCARRRTYNRAYKHTLLPWQLRMAAQKVT